MVMVAHSMGGLIATRYAQRHGDELAGLVLSAPAIGLRPVLGGLAGGTGAARRPDRRGGAVARRRRWDEAYADDPLVWHGGWKRPTLEAFHRAERGGRRTAPASATYRCSTSTARPTSSCRWRWPSRPCSAWRATDFAERIVPEARHEVFNELDQEQTIELVAAFAERFAVG